MNILAFDTAGNYCTVALAWQGQQYYKYMDITHGHATHLMPLISGVLEEAHAAYEGLDLIGVVVGPGSFTGIRVGVATAHGLSIATGKPLIAISAFELYARQVGEREALVIIDTRRNDLFAQRYDKYMHPIGLPKIIKPSEVGNDCLVVGNGLKLLDPQYHEGPNPEGLLKITQCMWENGRSTGLRKDCKPLYLREPDATANPL